MTENIRLKLATFITTAPGSNNQSEQEENLAPSPAHAAGSTPPPRMREPSNEKTTAYRTNTKLKRKN